MDRRRESAGGTRRREPHLQGEIMKKTAKTLIVDDSIAILELMDNMLREFGVRDITPAEDGLAAVELFRQALDSGAPYNLVFLDIVMPLMDGQAALKRMRGMEKEAGLTDGDRATIIMATSLHSTGDMIQAIIDGDCTDYLVKAFEPDDIRGMLLKYGFMECPRS